MNPRAPCTPAASRGNGTIDPTDQRIDDSLNAEQRMAQPKAAGGALPFFFRRNSGEHSLASLDLPDSSPFGLSFCLSRSSTSSFLTRRHSRSSSFQSLITRLSLEHQNQFLRLHHIHTTTMAKGAEAFKDGTFLLFPNLTLSWAGRWRSGGASQHHLSTTPRHPRLSLAVVRNSHA